jgi:hypothetical protein
MAKHSKAVEDTSAALNELLMGAAEKPKSKKGSGTPELSGHGELADKAYEAYKAQKSAEAEFAALEGQLIEATQAVYEAGARQGGFEKTYNVVGLTTPGCQVVRQDKFKSQPITAAKGLKEQLGDKFDQYFEVKRELTVEDPSDATVQLLLAKLGEADFKRIFQIKLTVEAKDDMDRRQFELAEDVRPAQYKPSVKIRK